MSTESQYQKGQQANNSQIFSG